MEATTENNAHRTTYITNFEWENDMKDVCAPLCAGYIAGICGIIVGHPLDSLKVLLQTGNLNGGTPNKAVGTPSPSPSPPPSNTTNTMPLPSTSSTGSNPNRLLSSVALKTSNKQALSVNNRKRSIRALYAGVTGPLLTVGMVQSINFAFYDTFRRLLYNGENENDAQNSSYLYNDPLSNVAISASLAGGLISVLTSPLMVVKTKQQVMLWSMKKAASDTLNHRGGLRNFYTGFIPHIFCDSIGRGVYFTSYEYLKRSIIKRNRENLLQEDVYSNPNECISLTERMICAGASGMICWTFIFPCDVIRSKIYARAALLPTMSDPPNAWTMTRDIWRNGGIKPFFRGFSITVARAGPVAAVVLPVYDLAFDWLQST